jgi:hypothetical protein
VVVEGSHRKSHDVKVAAVDAFDKDHSRSLHGQAACYIPKKDALAFGKGTCTRVVRVMNRGISEIAVDGGVVNVLTGHHLNHTSFGKGRQTLLSRKSITNHGHYRDAASKKPAKHSKCTMIVFGLFDNRQRFRINNHCITAHQQTRNGAELCLLVSENGFRFSLASSLDIGNGVAGVL